MGVQVILNIDPRGIDDAQWEAAYDETAMLLSAWQPPLLGWDQRLVEGIRVVMYTNSVTGFNAGGAHWCVVGDRETLRTAECQELYRDLSRYRSGSDRFDRSERPACNDIVVDAARADGHDSGRSVQVIGDTTQGYPYHFAVLAAAMLIEERFPAHAMVGGDIDRGQAKEAAHLAEPILKRRLVLPVRVDAPRLIERLKASYSPDELPGAFHRVYLGECGAEEAVLRAFPSEEGTRLWRAALSSHSSPAVLGVVRLMIDWLNSGRKLSDACRFACLEPAGPRYAPECFINTLALTWIAVPTTVREALGAFRMPTGAAHTVASLFGSFFLDMQATGRNLRITMEFDEIARELTQAFGDAAPELVSRLFRESATLEESLSELTGGVAALVEEARTVRPDDTESLITIRDVAALGEAQDLWVRVAAWNVQRAIARLKVLPGSMDALASTSKARRFIAQMIATHGPTITEGAWSHILTEESSEVLMWYMALVSLSSRGLHQLQVRRALLENQQLLRLAMALAADTSQMLAVEEIVTQARNQAKVRGL